MNVLFDKFGTRSMIAKIWKQPKGASLSAWLNFISTVKKNLSE